MRRVLALLRRVRDSMLLVTVRGPSMEPALHDGDRVLARRRPAAALRTGQVVVAVVPPPWRTVRCWQDGRRLPDTGSWPGGRPPGQVLMVKRVAAVPGERLPAALGHLRAHLGEVVPAAHLVLLGDNPGRSHDSRSFGFLPVGEVVGVLVGRHGVPAHRPGCAAGADRAVRALPSVPRVRRTR